MRVLGVSSDASRREMLRAAAELEAWDAQICCNSLELLRAVWRFRFSLVLVDLPSPSACDYRGLVEASRQIADDKSVLLFVTGAGGQGEEIASRSLGAWAYADRIGDRQGFEEALAGARSAIQRKLILESRCSVAQGDLRSESTPRGSSAGQSIPRAFP
jgi:DNA-binding response OmpR family regulator